MKGYVHLLLSSLIMLSCGGGKKEAETPIKQQTAADEILRVGQHWTSTLPEQGLLSPPSKISFFKNVRLSEIDLTPGAGHEVLTIEEHLQMRDGDKVTCRTRFEHALQIRYGRKQGEAAVEIIRPALSGPRTCNGVHPDGSIAEPSRRALFLLRSDTLTAVEPPLEKRQYLPQAM